MRSRRLLLILGPFVSILLIVAFYQSITAGRLEPYSKGEKLSFARLAPNETITVTHVISHRGSTGREYRMEFNEQTPRFTACDILGENEHYPSPTHHRKVLATRTLSAAEADGLDALVAFFRSRGEERSSAERFYRFDYTRDGKKIGEELFIGFWLVDQLDHLAETGARANPGYDSDYDQLAQGHGLTRAQLDRMVTFRMLEKLAPDPSWASAPPSADSAPRRKS